MLDKKYYSRVCKKIFLNILLFTLIPISVMPQNWNAVIVGINDYPGTQNDLNYCVNDANIVKYYLEFYKQWNSSKVSRLINGDDEESEIQSATQSMLRTPGNTNFFFFAGHGDSEELGENDGLIPANSLDARITQSELQSYFGSTFNQYAVFLDACGTGIFPRDMNKGVISSACKANEESKEGLNGHGYYTYYLLQSLKQSSLNTAEQTHSYAHH